MPMSTITVWPQLLRPAWLFVIVYTSVFTGFALSIGAHLTPNRVNQTDFRSYNACLTLGLREKHGFFTDHH